jgi:aspartate 4-decarboxylase
MAARKRTKKQQPERMQLSPFELKDELIRLARDRTQAKSASQQFLNAGRGNPNWTATTPREAFFQLGQFALTECKRDWDEPDLGGMPQREGCARRLTRFLEAAGPSPGRTLLEASLEYGVQTLGFEPDAFVHELTDSIIGDNYPVPGRMLEHCERIVHAFIAKEMCAGKPPRGRFDLFAVEGGTAAMCYLFNSLMTNGLLKAGDTIALGTPIFTPYIEMTHLSGFKTVNIEQSEMKKGIHTWRYPESELRKLENPRVKAFFLVNPANPASVAIDPASMRRIVALVKNKRPDLLLLTDDVYGTFIPGFRSLAAELPRNTILVYSYSKHFGCTGWRLGVIGIHQDNILDAALARMPRAKRAALEYRYSSLTPHPEAMKFIDRMVADSRNVALNHTSGVSLPQQVQMALFSLFSLLDPGDAYTLRCRGIVQERLARLLKGLGVDDIPADPYRAAYYAVLDLEAWARRTWGDEFMEWATREHVPLDIVYGLARNFGTVLLNGDGFGGPAWSARVSLANLPTDAYEQIGQQVATGTSNAVARWQASQQAEAVSAKSSRPSSGKSPRKSASRTKTRTAARRKK